MTLGIGGGGNISNTMVIPDSNDILCGLGGAVPMSTPAISKLFTAHKLGVHYNTLPYPRATNLVWHGMLYNNEEQWTPCTSLASSANQSMVDNGRELGATMGITLYGMALETKGT